MSADNEPVQTGPPCSTCGRRMILASRFVRVVEDHRAAPGPDGLPRLRERWGSQWECPNRPCDHVMALFDDP